MFIARLALAFLLPSLAQAHPVAQGAMEIQISPTEVRVRATVSDEEILVENTYSGRKLSLLQATQAHGAYLLAHLRASVDGRPLTGVVLSVPKSVEEKPVYQLAYALPESARPKQLRFEEDLLREFLFAPGNPWEATYLVRIGHEGRAASDGLLLSFHQPLTYDFDWEGSGANAVTRFDTAKTFVHHGVLHILTGYDHLLFVTALLLAVTGLWDLLLVISAFTLAHTITLIVSALNWFRLPESVVEPMIAASIVFVAVQNLFWPRQSRGWSRLAVAFGFGLFHGLGFAGGLLDAMSSLQGSFAAVAIASFSLGVEIGHQAVVIPLFLILKVMHSRAQNPKQVDAIVKPVSSAVIALAGLYYLVAALRH